MADPNTANRHHITQVDYIRAIASLAVALFHMGGKTLPGLNKGWLGVNMFFLLSGFIICWAIPRDYTLKMFGRFITKRLVRIEPPYIVSIILALAAHFIRIPQYTPDWPNVLFHLAYINSFLGKEYLNPVYWTLGIEFQFYFFVALFFPVIARKIGPYFVLILCLLPVFHIGSNLISVFPTFGLGIIYFQYYKKIISIKTAVIIGALVAAASFYCSGLEQTFAALFALTLLVLPLKRNAIISFFSRISFSLYLTHDIVGSNIVVYLGTLLPKTFFYKGVEFLTGITISILFAYLFYRLLEKPCLALSKRIKYDLSTK